MQDAEEAHSDADGVLVMSAWTPGPDGRLLARITMTVEGSAEVVEVVSSPAEVHALVDRWLASLGA